MMGLPKMDGFKVHQFFRSFVGSPCRAMAKKTTGQSWWRIPEDRSESTRRSTPEMQGMGGSRFVCIPKIDICTAYFRHL